ncbi:Fc.00g019520.m01.CDS01 [Cosmosporella sp. VM-42]
MNRHQSSRASREIASYTHLSKLPQEKKALEILKQVAHNVKPILRAHGWRLRNLAEFYPSDKPKLQGLNTTSRILGTNICLRLRSARNKLKFKKFHKIMDIILHELAHVEGHNHDRKFRNRLKQIEAEYKDLQRNGYAKEINTRSPEQQQGGSATAAQGAHHPVPGTPMGYDPMVGRWVPMTQNVGRMLSYYPGYPPPAPPRAPPRATVPNYPQYPPTTPTKYPSYLHVSPSPYYSEYPPVPPVPHHAQYPPTVPAPGYPQYPIPAPAGFPNQSQGAPTAPLSQVNRPYIDENGRGANNVDYCASCRHSEAQIDDLAERETRDGFVTHPKEEEADEAKITQAALELRTPEVRKTYSNSYTGPSVGYFVAPRGGAASSWQMDAAPTYGGYQYHLHR